MFYIWVSCNFELKRIERMRKCFNAHKMNSCYALLFRLTELGLWHMPQRQKKLTKVNMTGKENFLWIKEIILILSYIFFKKKLKFFLIYHIHSKHTIYSNITSDSIDVVPLFNGSSNLVPLYFTTVSIRTLYEYEQTAVWSTRVTNNHNHFKITLWQVNAHWNKQTPITLQKSWRNEAQNCASWPHIGIQCHHNN
jgi:hypothetical protein